MANWKSTDRQCSQRDPSENPVQKQCPASRGGGDKAGDGADVKPESETSSARVKEKQTTTVSETMATMRSRKFWYYYWYFVTILILFSGSRPGHIIYYYFSGHYVYIYNYVHIHTDMLIEMLKRGWKILKNPYQAEGNKSHSSASENWMKISMGISIKWIIKNWDS